MWVAPSPLKKSVPEQGFLQMCLNSYWSGARLGMGKRKGWMCNPHLFRHWPPKVLCLRDAPFRGDLGQDWNNNLKSLPSCWRKLKAYFVPSPHTWIKQTVSQACERGEDSAAPHRREETPLPSSHSHLLLRAAEGQTWESTLSITVCLIRFLRGSHQKQSGPLGKKNIKANMSLLTTEVMWKTLIDFNFSRKWPNITVKLMDLREWHFASCNAKQQIKLSCFLL